MFSDQSLEVPGHRHLDRMARYNLIGYCSARELLAESVFMPKSYSAPFVLPHSRDRSEKNTQNVVESAERETLQCKMPK